MMGDIESKRQRLRSKSKSDALTIVSTGLATIRPLRSRMGIPIVVEPTYSQEDMVSWVVANEKHLAGLLLKSGAILFRGFGVESVERFNDFVRAFTSELLEYTERSTPRSQISGNVYTSTEYPPDQTILMHSEMSYARNWPRKIWFFSFRVADQGGETPIADNRKVLQRIDPILRDRFINKQVMYIRNFDNGLDIPWEIAFQTPDRRKVEEYCLQKGIDFEWKNDGGLRTRQVRPAIQRHPETGELVWFNQAHLFHVASLPEEVHRSLLGTLRESDYPRNAYFGDGAPIEDDVIRHINDAFLLETAAFPWRMGDILMVDNMLVSHGRKPFSGKRTVAVAMAEAYGG